MYLDEKYLKRIITKSYKGNGLTLGNDGDGIFIEGGSYAIWMRSSEIPKKIKAIIIELTGELPGEGEIFTATPEGNQYELELDDVWNVRKSFRAANIEYEITPLVMYNRGGVTRFLQAKEGNKVVEMSEDLLNVVNKYKIEQNSAEHYPVGPLSVTEVPSTVFWNNDICTVALETRREDTKKEEELHKVLEGYRWVREDSI